MLKIIDGRRYNTDTATEVAEYSNYLGAGDFHTLPEPLYKTPKGAWFIHGKGGPQTAWAHYVGSGNGRTGGEGMRVLSDEEAMKWLERHNMAGELEEHFADKIEDA